VLTTSNKQRISDEWDQKDQQLNELIDTAIKQWCKRLTTCFSAQGGHLERTLKAQLQVD